MALFTRDEALDYHRCAPKGKVEVVPVKPCLTQKHLSMAYSPGVAETCREIHKDPEKVYDYTAKGNLVAVVSNGTAVLGLGNIGPLAGKPVMEGKGVLFKTFADIDVFDINLDTSDPEKIIEVVKMLEPTFGGINLEDIKAPECFHIEKRLKEIMSIPVFHDDQHGTAIICGAGILNATEISGKRLSDCKVIISGAGAAAIACAEFCTHLGMSREQIFMFDSKGLIHKNRSNLNEYKSLFAQDKDQGSMAELFKGADIFLGLSVKDMVTPEMVKSMAKDPIIFAMANPDPEIPYPLAREARPDCIMGTGRSDFPNQVNNVSGFPYIFRGALDVRATDINEEMKVAAARSLAALAKEPVPDEIKQAYGVKELSFGKDYIIPKALDPRVLEWEAPAVAKAAMDTGVARIRIDLDEYPVSLRKRLEGSQKRIREYVKSYDFGF
jgi:malate dehydrogenase (oxaloacetate-decarboxylating)(NADP+)